MCTFYVNRYIQSQISKDLIVCVCVLPYGLNTSQTENSLVFQWQVSASCQTGSHFLVCCCFQAVVVKQKHFRHEDILIYNVYFDQHEKKQVCNDQCWASQLVHCLGVSKTLPNITLHDSLNFTCSDHFHWLWPHFKVTAVSILTEMFGFCLIKFKLVWLIKLPLFRPPSLAVATFQSDSSVHFELRFLFFVWLSSNSVWLSSKSCF